MLSFALAEQALRIGVGHMKSRAAAAAAAGGNRKLSLPPENVSHSELL